MYNLTVDEAHTFFVGDGQWLVHNQDDDLPRRTLLIGEGDFSFGQSLVTTGQVNPLNTVATSYDSFPALPSQAHQHLDALRQAGVEILHGVDARLLHQYNDLGDFDRIIWNFPHDGESAFKSIVSNKQLLEQFFGSAQSRLTDQGLIEVTLKNGWPYSSWKVLERAASQGLRLVKQIPFKLSSFPGYTPITTRSSNPIDLTKGATIHKFCK